MFSLLLAVIYAAFISLGLPDALLGSAWPTMYRVMNVPVSYAGIVSMIISCGTVISSLMSDRAVPQARHASRHGHQRRPDGAGTIRLFFGRRVLAALCLGGAVRARRGQCRCRSE